MGGFTDTLLVEGGFAVLRVVLIVPVGTMGFFLTEVNPFKALGELMGCDESRELGARECLVFLGLSSWEAPVVLYSWRVVSQS